jgi:hypothetical protein
MSNNQSHITIRYATPSDRPALERLAQRDSGRVPSGELLVAELDGELVAAVPLEGGTAIADPFRPTAGHVAALAAEAGHPAPLTTRARAFKRLWQRSPRPAGPKPSAPSVPGLPVLGGPTR